jgi:hypothetical protein
MSLGRPWDAEHQLSLQRDCVQWKGNEISKLFCRKPEIKFGSDTPYIMVMVAKSDNGRQARPIRIVHTCACNYSQSLNSIASKFIWISHTCTCTLRTYTCTCTCIFSGSY